MEQIYDFQFPSTNTSLKSASATGPSRKVVENLLNVAQTECGLLKRISMHRRCFQQIRFESIRMEICLN